MKHKLKNARKKLTETNEPDGQCRVADLKESLKVAVVRDKILS